MRRSRLRPYNPERRARLREEQFGDHGNRVRALPCCACGALPPSDPAHVVHTRGAGGKWQHIAPLCRRCHRQQEARTDAFDRERGTDLRAVAARLAEAAELPACYDSRKLMARLARIDPPRRIAMLHAAPWNMPKSVSTGMISEVVDWLKEWGHAAEAHRVLDLWEALS